MVYIKSANIGLLLLVDIMSVQTLVGRYQKYIYILRMIIHTLVDITHETQDYRFFLYVIRLNHKV